MKNPTVKPVVVANVKAAPQESGFENRNEVFKSPEDINKSGEADSLQPASTRNN